MPEVRSLNAPLPKSALISAKNAEIRPIGTLRSSIGNDCIPASMRARFLPCSKADL